ncbi:MAG TPA: PD-(D/E)XK nuclease family protein [Thermoanaerobaculia bacterium]|nr:PD-(D/E)XK nuclease family protein [Thermoanaerobaculia bacterium]
MTRGSLAAEALLLDRLEALVDEARQDPSLLAFPVRIVVPSRSLRLHLSAVMARRLRRSMAGVLVQSLHRLALEVMERAGEDPPRGAPLFEVVAQRLARRERALSRGLEGLVDGYAAVTGTVRDLFDAGLEPALAEAVEEALASDGRLAGSRAEVDRAKALVRVAARAEIWMRGRGLGRVSSLLRRATELIESDPAGLLPARAVLIHGFSDATGVATDLIQTLLRRRSAWLLLDHPPDAAGAAAGEEVVGVERAFTERFSERLTMVAPLEDISGDSTPKIPHVTGFEALGGESEAREIALRVRSLLEAGTRPETIGVVARDLIRYRLLLRRHFRRLGIPFSGVGEPGALGPAGRRARAFLDLIRRGEDVPADRWLDAVVSFGGRRAGLLVDLRLAFYTLGAGRLRAVAELPVDDILKDNDSFPLPIRQGLRRAGADPDADEADLVAADEGQGAYAPRRRIDASRLRRAVLAAGQLRERLAGWPDETRAIEHFLRLRRLLDVDLGWKKTQEEVEPVFAALDELESQVPGDLPLTRDELRLLLARSLEEIGMDPLGGDGGGVQVLTVTEARGRTFDHLFLVGLNRDVFPRPVREDPLLPDDLRRLLQRVLPDIPIKRNGFDEDRYLFAQLLSASPAVTLSWQAADDDGAPLSVSPLVERLRTGIDTAKVPPLYALPRGEVRPPRPAAEHAVLAGLFGSRQALVPVLSAALAESRPDGAGALAEARIAVLNEMDPDRRTHEGRETAAGLGPYFGFLGGISQAEDPRRRDLFVTYLENLAACPWQLFLGRLLRIEPTPDPLDALPGADPLLLGNLVHATLERVVRLAAPEVFTEEAPPLAEVLARRPVPIAWPEAAELDRVLLAEASRLLAEEGIFLPGFARALADRVRPMLDAARESDWGTAPLPVLGIEVEGELTVHDEAGQPHPLHFKADRLDLWQGSLRWTDYKTGKPISDKRTADTRRRHFLARVKTGAYLQGVAYLLASQEGGHDSAGRYLFLRPDVEEREFAVAPDDMPFVRAFEGAVSAVLGAWETGSFFPRVVDAAGRNEPPRCGFCAVAEACQRGDSGSRLRLFEWAGRAQEQVRAGQTLPAADQGAWKVWRLTAKDEPEPKAEETR